MARKQKESKHTWRDPDDAPAWTEEQLARAALAEGGSVVRKAKGTITKRGRPKKDRPKALINIRLDEDILDAFKAGGAGWQSRINKALREWVSKH